MKKLYILLYISLMLVLCSSVSAYTYVVNTTAFNSNAAGQTAYLCLNFTTNTSTNLSLIGVRVGRTGYTTCKIGYSCNGATAEVKDIIANTSAPALNGVYYEGNFTTAIQLNASTKYTLGCGSTVAMTIDYVAANPFPITKPELTWTGGWDNRVYSVASLIFNSTEIPSSDSYAFDVALAQPLNNTLNNSLTQTFWYNVTWYNSSVSNCSLYTNQTGTWDIRISNGTQILNKMNTYFQIALPSDGSYKWNVGCWNGTTNLVYAPNNWTLNIHTEIPVVELVYPANTTLSNNATMTFKCNITDGYNISNLTLNIWNSTDSLVNTNKTSLTGTSNSTMWNFTPSYDDTYHWNCLGADVANNTDWASDNWTYTKVTPFSSIQINIYPTNASINNTASFFQYLVGIYGGNVQNCSLWTDFTGTWAYTDINDTPIVNDTESANLFKICYQESANTSNQTGTDNCDSRYGLSYTGSYENTISITPQNCIDGNWSSYCTYATHQQLYINYTKPFGALNSSLWQKMSGSSIMNLTINNSCWEQSPLQFRINISIVGSDSIYYCKNATEWVEMRSELGAGSHNIFEEAMWWNISTTKIAGFHSENNITTAPFTTSGNYTWGINCIGIDGSSYWSNANFTLTIDSVIPTITPSSRLLNNLTIVYNGTFSANINYSDDRELYSILTTINGVVVTNQTNIGTNFYQDNISYFIGTNLYNNITTKVCDSHTAQSIKTIDDIRIDNSKKGLVYAVKNRWLWLQDDYIKIYPKNPLSYKSPSTTKLDDRYNFKFHKLTAPNAIETFVVESNMYIDIDKLQLYDGQLVIPDMGANGYWTDFETDDAKEYVLRRISNTMVEIDVYGMKNKNIEFNSLGELNCDNATYYFGNLNPASYQYDNVFMNGNYTFNLTIHQEPIVMTSINATLYYNNTQYYAGATPNFSTSIIVPNVTTSANITSYWMVNIDGVDYNLSSNTTKGQNVSNFFLDNCSAYTTSSVNISFFDEKNLTSIAINPFGTYTYTINSITKTYTLSETTKNTTRVCINPAYANSTGVIDIYYSSALYPQRRFINNTYFDNSSRTYNLYGLNVADGIYATFILSGASGALKNATGSMAMINVSNWIVVDIEKSDDTGLMLFWANPDTTYRFVFSSPTCTDATYYIRPTASSPYSITLNCGSSISINESYSSGITYSFTPTNGLLMNDTSYSFGTTINSTYWDITSCQMYLLNGSNTSIQYATNTSAFTTGYCSNVIYYLPTATGTIISRIAYKLNGSTWLYADKFYDVQYTYEGQFSLKNFIDDLSNFGANGFNNATRFFLAFVLSFLITALVAYKFDVSETNVLIGVSLGCIWFFSYINWFYLSYPMPSEFMKQYIVAIIATLAGGSYFIKEMAN